MKKLIDKIVAPTMWRIVGNFPYENGDIRRSANKITAETSAYVIETDYEEDAFGVYRLTGKLKAKEAIVLNALDLLLTLGGGEFEVYTAYNGWQNESVGTWQKLNTAVLTESNCSRTSSGAAPFMALWNRQTNRGLAIHLLPDFAWEMKASYLPDGGELAKAVVEIGINKENFCFRLEKGETIPTPDILFYEFTNKLDMDCYKLHNFWHKHYSKKSMPVTYNTWMSHFDKISFENVKEQIKIAAELGVEYFVIDAGWFGKGENWWDSRGDWDENLTGGFCGRMMDLSNEVRSHHMKFGLWLEIESASMNSDIVKRQPEFFIARNELRFLDFSNEKACQYIIDTVSGLVEKYHIEYIKFDYNQDMLYDDQKRAYVDYFEGYFRTIKRIKNKYPAIFFDNCASGGQRLNLKNCMDFDGFWPSDNESPYEQLKMFKNTVLRLPPQYFDRWVALSRMPHLFPVYDRRESEKNLHVIACGDALWGRVEDVHESFLRGFLTGGQIGLSCDLTKFSKELLVRVKGHISKIKEERNFWDRAVCRILASTDEILVIEYADMDFQEVKILTFSFKTRQNRLYVYPYVDEDSRYYVKDIETDGKEISTNGLEIAIEGNYRASCVALKKIG